MISTNPQDQSIEQDKVSVSFSFDEANLQNFNEELSSLYSESLNASLYDQFTEIEPLDEINRLIPLEREKKLFIPEEIQTITGNFCDDLISQYNDKVGGEMTYTVSTKGNTNTVTHKFTKTPSGSSGTERDKLINEGNVKQTETETGTDTKQKAKKTKRVITEMSSYSRNKSDLKGTFTDDHLLTND